MNGETPPPEEHEWEAGWDGHRTAQMRRMARLTLREKIAWLEEAQQLVERIQAARARRRSAER